MGHPGRTGLLHDGIGWYNGRMKHYYQVRKGKIPDAFHPLSCKCDLCFLRLLKARKASRQGKGRLRVKMMAERIKRLEKKS